MLLLKYSPGWVTITSAPVLMILVSALYSLLLPLALSLVLSGLAVLMFNYELVPPVHTFHVDLKEHGILLVTMMVVSGVITYLLRRQKELAAQEHEQARRALQLVEWGNALREADDPHGLLPQLYQLLKGRERAGQQLVLGFQNPQLPQGCQLTSIQQEGFMACLKENRALGLLAGRYDTLEDLYLPMRGKFRAHGVCLWIDQNEALKAPGRMAHVQALLDQMGQACERFDNLQRMQNERELAQNQKVRSLFLTSIAHDQRTPLASIMTSASAILEQVDRLVPEQICHYAELICSESQQVLRLTDNTLALARLSGEQVQVPMQPESVEDVVAAVLQRLRRRNMNTVPHVEVEPGLPLLTCNMVLIEQVLDNLLDNAARHSGAPHTVSLQVNKLGDTLCFQVRDEGKGMSKDHSGPMGDQARGLGIGLQLCRAVAAIHGGQLTILPSDGRGACVQLRLPWRLAGSC